MKFREFYNLFLESPEMALGDNREEMTYMDDDSITFGIGPDGSIHMGGVDDVPEAWNNRKASVRGSMTHARLYAINAAKDIDDDHDPHSPTAYREPWGRINSHIHYKTLGRAWCRGGVLYISFWKKGAPSDVTMKYIVRELKRGFPDGKLSLIHI
jgi:hypothetical protein